MTAVLVIGLLMTAIALPLAARRVSWIYRLIRSGQPAPDRVEGVTGRVAAAVKTQVVEVFGQKSCSSGRSRASPTSSRCGASSSSRPSTSRPTARCSSDFRDPGRRPLGHPRLPAGLLRRRGAARHHHLRDHPAALEPKEHGRDSRFYGSHTGGAWLILFMIFNVIWTYALFRGSGVNTGNLPYGNGAFFSHTMGCGAGAARPATANEWIENVALLLHIGVMLVFLLIVLHSKHLHIGLAPINVTFKRLPNALGPLLLVDGKPCRSTSRIPPRTRCSGAARSRTSPGRATSTSPRAPSAAAASRSARRGTPESRCRPSSSS